MNKIAVKELAYFVYQSGDLTSEFFSNHDKTKGQKAHSYLQAKYNDLSSKEVYIKNEFTYDNKEYLIHGFIDGILNIEGKIIIEEIKSTTLDLDLIDLNYHKEHLAQAKIYAYLYALNNHLDQIYTRLTYISVVDYETKSIELLLQTEELEEFFFSSLSKYIEFHNYLEQTNKQKQLTIKDIKFPFKTKRLGQNKLMQSVYNTLTNNEILYAIAPTGIGKTMACLFSSLKALKPLDKLFYLTAKTSGKKSAIDALKILKNEGLKIKAINISAKRKICNCNFEFCKPLECKYAKGFFDRLKVATLEIFLNHDIYDTDLILEIANKHTICAFEFSLYLSYFCDVVVCDYNYVFDPYAHLIRYFEDDTYKPKVLVDEAHNLISRSKEMYSSFINEKMLRNLRKASVNYKPSIRNYCNNAIKALANYQEYLTEKALYVDTLFDSNLHNNLKILIAKCDEVILENKDDKKINEFLKSYYEIFDFVRTSETFSESHRLIAHKIDDDIELAYFCLDASSFLLNTINKSICGTVFFSATLSPLDYHMNLLSKGEGNILELPSSFDPNKLDIIINNQISTKYKNRTNSIDDILEIIEESISVKEGNYIVFFPSYQYLKMISDVLNIDDYNIIIQKSNYTDIEKEEVINKFKNNKKNLGLFVLGGTFSEGIDFIGDCLNGVIIVGVGMPSLSDENNILKDYFDEKYNKGFEYSYIYPGFIKVIQAVGRVIRSDSDVGFAILIDERFTYNNYLKLMPPHWTNLKVINNSYNLKQELISFYKKHEK